MKQVPFNKPFIAGKELYYISRSVLNGKISGDASFSRACESILSELCDGARVMMTPSCTAALEMACLLIDLQPGDEVIMPSFTFVSTANAVALRGAVPVFSEICSDTFNLDPEKLERCITPKTRAIMPVHYAGQCCDMKAIREIADRHGLKVIEDAAQGVGAYHHDRHLGTFGELACYSFHETKNIMCGEGGALVINDPDMAARAEIIREKGTNRSAFFRGEVDKYTWVDVGSSFLPSDLQMAFLYAQLEQLSEITERRRTIYQFYHDHLLSLERRGKLQRPVTLPENRINYHLYPILCKDLAERTAMIQLMKQRDIHPVFHYVPLHHSPAGKRIGKTPFALPITEEAADRLLRLPVYFEIEEAEMRRVIEAIEDFYNT
jgi:dTDP-4-amino-4,6-dideoxygalactose transaminase